MEEKDFYRFKEKMQADGIRFYFRKTDKKSGRFGWI
jgi:hypothetical protein